MGEERQMSGDTRKIFDRLLAPASNSAFQNYPRWLADGVVARKKRLGEVPWKDVDIGQISYAILAHRAEIELTSTPKAVVDGEVRGGNFGSHSILPVYSDIAEGKGSLGLDGATTYRGTLTSEQVTNALGVLSALKAASRHPDLANDNFRRFITFDGKTNELFHSPGRAATVAFDYAVIMHKLRNKLPENPLNTLTTDQLKGEIGKCNAEIDKLDSATTNSHCDKVGESIAYYQLKKRTASTMPPTPVR